MTDNISAYKFDWPPITVEGYKEAENKVVMVFNVDVGTPAKVEHVIQYVVGRTLWCSLNSPAKVNILLSFDFRGQGIIVTKTQSLKSEILRLLNKANITNQVSIDFLI
jgi:protein involved in sex pheromone biosynthesis